MGINNELIRSLGMTLIHSLWEGLAVMVMLLFALSVAGRSNARFRYIILVSGLMILLTGFFATWYILYHRNIQFLHQAGLSQMIYPYGARLVNVTSRTLDPVGYISSVHHFLEPFYPLLAMGWILGFVFMAIKTTGGFYLSFRIIKNDIYKPDTSLLVLFEKIRAELKMSARSQLRLTSRMISPMVIGVIKPLVIVPAAILTGLNTGQVEAILVHELAHIRRYDHLVLIIQAVATQILFFHPIAWYLANEINRERENCCDDIVMKTFPNPINYIKALTMIQELNLNGPVPANALLGRSKRLLCRVKRLLKPETKQAPAFRITMMLLFMIILGIAAITLTTAGNAGNKESKGGLLTGIPEKTQADPDTIKDKKNRKVIVKADSRNQDGHKMKKEMADARRKYEKARIEMEKARIEMEKARQELEMAHAKTRSQDMAFIQGEAMRALNDARFKMEHDVDVQVHLKNLNRDLGRLNADVQEKIQHFRQQDWEQFRQEWQKSGEQMRKAMENFYRSRKDSDLFHIDAHPFLNAPPLSPDCLPVPPIMPDFEIPEVRDIDIDIPEMDIDIRVSPGPERRMELFHQDQEAHEHNEDQETPDTENSNNLNSKLRELEE